MPGLTFQCTVESVVKDGPMASAVNQWSFKTGGLSWQWSPKTGSTVLVNEPVTRDHLS